jgi:hypothetical protein
MFWKAAMSQTANHDLRAHRTADSLGSRLAVAASPFGVGGRTIEAAEVSRLLVKSVLLGLGFGLTLALLMRLSLVWGI